jgi:uncharacterized protein YutE (UPF0331/DUF86 family)
MVRQEVIRKRLNKLDAYLDILCGMHRYSLDDFLADPERYGSAERFLQLAIEALTDLGNHVIADLRLGTVDTYGDVAAILADKGYIDAELKDTWLKIVGFRNVLVHDYAELDRRVVYDVLTNRLGDLEQLRKVFAQFL